jgi:dimethylamine--corrinoid protein Co-methyltransferase
VGVGDPLGMACSHALASGMGGMRAAGDLVARMQMTRGMRLEQAKTYVAGRLGVSVIDLADPLVMHEVRRELGLGMIPVQELTYPNDPGAIEAKFHIADVLDVPINSVRKFNEHIGRRGGARAAGVAARQPEVSV